MNVQANEITDSIRASQRRNNYFHDVLCGHIPADPSRSFTWEDAPEMPSRLDVLHKAILKVQLSGEKVDLRTVSDQLYRDGTMRLIGGLAALNAFIETSELYDHE